MTILSIVCRLLLCTNAHLGRRVAAHHFKVYICGSRNGIAILDSDKTLICLRNALHFIGSPIRQKGRSFFLKTNHLFRYEIMEEMASCINDSQWKIGAFFTNSFANKKKFHSRKKKINFGLNQQPDCAVILNADRKSSVILEADRSQIPIASLVDSTIPWESHKRITYSIPANDPIQFVYLFRHSITKTVIQERPRIQKMKVDLPIALRHFTLNTGKSAGIRPYSTTSYSSPKGKNKNTLFFFFSLIMLLSLGAIIFVLNRYAPGATELLQELARILVEWVLCLCQSLYGIFVGGRCATLGGVDQEWTRSSAEETSTAGKPLLMEGGDWDSLEPIGEIPPLSPGRGMVGPSQPSSSTQEAGRPASDSGPAANPTTAEAEMMMAPSGSHSGAASSRGNAPQDGVWRSLEQPASEGAHCPPLSSRASTPSSSFFRGVSSDLEAAAAPAEPGEEVQQGAFEPLNLNVLPGVPQEELFSAIPQNLGPALPQVPAAPPAPPAAPAQPLELEQLQTPTLSDFHQLMRNHQSIADLLPRIFQDLHTRVPAGFQSERLAEMLEERYGGRNLGGILLSLQEEGRNSRFFREVQTDFQTLRDSGATEATLRKEWQGRF